ncbi:MAG: phosphoribosylformylglycinamidine synthase subunit PurQ [Acidobacteriota bacterium]
MKFGIIVFPGSNCDHDTYHVVKHALGQECAFLWHKDTDLQSSDVIVVPGGFSYGDYLRCGAIAKFSPVMESVRKHAEQGKPVIGICNGFQILQEAGLLPGVMLRNKNLKFICDSVFIRTENHRTPFTSQCSPGQVLNLPIAHNEGNFFVSDQELKDLQQNGQIVFRYCDRNGKVSAEANPNGSLDGIAGVSNREGNVLGLMPHPERAAESLLGSADGRFVFESIMDGALCLKAS